ncbi:diphosphomevalonate decarboxylase [Neocloeon triangulifer]|uniref:diphosphomevalonate decarboxylase n=1 Tax=Neocloeon triangulifer TaxID=2078957 RepID=UPI00286F25E2|nr:diphosphomevalonate decarboxylase [Neocloeon triangulifer]
MKVVTCVAPVNIAVIKYWGKRDEELILPLNDSISATLSTDHMHAKTTVMASETFTEDKIWLNGKEESIENPRLQNCLKDLREKAKREGDAVTANLKVHICSVNNFPTAAGLASSAAGYACLVYTLAKVFGVEGDVSSVARRGSGSACRSVFGGFVRWHQGELLSGEDSLATQIVPANHWPQMRILILVVSDARKTTSSTSGMQRSVETSELLTHRIKNCVPKRVEAMKKAIEERDFETFAEITMKDSNQFHAVCLDTYPPAVYLNDVSHAIIRLVHQYNAACGQIKVAYTFDAGPNACLYLLEQDVPTVAALVRLVFPPNPEQQQDFFRGIPVIPSVILPPINEPPQVGKIRYVIHTKVGEGPSQVDDHLLSEDGQPK